MKLKLNVKQIIILIVASVVLVSCTPRTPIIGGVTPFVVEKIERHNKTKSCYHAKTRLSGHSNNVFTSNARIIMETGLFQIGDTIKTKHFLK